MNIKILKLSVLFALAPLAGFAQQEDITERQPPVVTVEKVQENEKMAQIERVKDQEERAEELQEQQRKQKVTSNINSTAKTTSTKPKEQ